MYLCGFFSLSVSSHVCSAGYTCAWPSSMSVRCREKKLQINTMQNIVLLINSILHTFSIHHTLSHSVTHAHHTHMLIRVFPLRCLHIPIYIYMFIFCLHIRRTAVAAKLIGTCNHIRIVYALLW